jgi:hypothetical protein
MQVAKLMERKLVIGLILFVLAAYLVSGIRYAAYRPVVSDNYLWAVYHVHSTMSDGLNSPAEIACQARKARVALVILTDHRSPNRAASAFRLTVNGVAVIGGSEVKLPDGRLTFFGATENPRLSLASSAPQAMDQARLSGAFPIISYSEDSLYGWRYWESDLNPDGIEISNLFSSVRALTVFRGFLLALYYPFSPYYFLKSVSFPAQSLSRWDDFLARRKTWGLIAADAHGGFHIGKWLAVPVPSYAAAFSLAGLGIARKYSSEPEVAIRNGDFFNCIRGAGEPLLFDFFASAGTLNFSSGSAAPDGASLHAAVRTANQPVRLVLIRDGTIAQQVQADRLDVLKTEAGVYRLEVYLVHHPLLPANVPWIVSNPIFIGEVPYFPRPLPPSSNAMNTPRPRNDSSARVDVTAIR